MNDYANTTPGNALGTNLGVEAVAEFSVLTNSYSAEYGCTSGGVINAITRSGTNQIRGTVFEFHRNSAMAPRTTSIAAAALRRSAAISARHPVSSSSRCPAGT